MKAKSAALHNQFLEYSITPHNRYDIDAAFNSALNLVSQQLKDLVQKHFALKFQIKAHVFFDKFDFELSRKVDLDTWFSTESVLILTKNQIFGLVLSSFRKLLAFYDSFVQGGSGWVLKKVQEIVLTVAKFRLFKGGCADKVLPYPLQKSRAILRTPVISNDFCFLYAVTLALGAWRKKKNKSRFNQKDIEVLKHLPTSGLSFPATLDDILKFEKQVKFSVNVYGYEPIRIGSKTHAIFPYYISHFVKERRQQINLLYHQQHFFPIINLATLLKKNRHKNQRKSYVCRFCLSVFPEKNLLHFHESLCNQQSMQIKMPDSDEKAKKRFSSFRNIIAAPFVIYADFESIILPSKAINKGKQISKTFHQCCSWGAMTVCRDNSTFDSDPVMYTGPDSVKHFLSHLELEFERVQKILVSTNFPIKMTLADEADFDQATHCKMCNISFEDVAFKSKMRDHNHLNGRYRGALCNTCNLKHAIPSKKVVVFFHGLSNYDSHFIIKELHKYNDKSINIIPRSAEKFLSFEVGDLVFKDSYMFLSEKLETLASNLRDKGEDNFVYMQKHVPDKSCRALLFQKGFFPYTYLSSLAKLNDEKLPPPIAFFNDLTQTPIDPKDYNFAQKVWEKFDCRNFGDYLKVYLFADLILLTDIFENFRNNCLNDYQLDPVHYFSSAHFTMDAFLRYSDQTIDLIRDVNMYLLFKKLVKGGLSMVSKRFSEASNKYLTPTLPVSDSTYLLYLDANNLYGWAMMQPLPYRNFKWHQVSSELVSHILNLPCSSQKGYVLEVDLSYPSKYHSFHNDFPLAPEKDEIDFSDLSPFARDLCEKQSSKSSLNVPKLITTLRKKEKYVVYHKNLQLYLKLGLELTKTHKILEFEQKPIMKDYIEFNSAKRAASTNNFDSTFYKFLSNSLYGKTMERPDNKSQIKLANNIEAYENYVSRLNFKQAKVIHENLVSLELKYPSFTITKPFFIGAIILELAKYHMYNFHYNVMKEHFGEKLQLLYTDTDSLLYEIKCEDVYEELQNIQKKNPAFDFSNYPKSHKLYDTSYKKVPGFFKDETSGMPPQAFVGLRSKMYAVKMPAENDIKHAKGVKKVIIDKSLTFEDFKSCLFNSDSLQHDYRSIRSDGHSVFTSHQFKKTLGSFDDKRWLQDEIHSLAYGHDEINSICTPK